MHPNRIMSKIRIIVHRQNLPSMKQRLLQKEEELVCPYEPVRIHQRGMNVYCKHDLDHGDIWTGGSSCVLDLFVVTSVRFN